mmetsp:Transcript_11085/g.27242  ORF Transcript_11085/g.27242 Transcript_11085/m.27242 type:complete len:89 (+) Transcript_11085:61-327(+)
MWCSLLEHRDRLTAATGAGWTARHIRAGLPAAGANCEPDTRAAPRDRSCHAPSAQLPSCKHGTGVNRSAKSKHGVQFKVAHKCHAAAP